ncbi:hypothetical protein K2X05_10455 [bacterium]|nr:hypothetical protein [bacterium]
MPNTTSGAISISDGIETKTTAALFTVNAISVPPSIQQGNKLVGTGNVGSAEQATSLAISADGNTAIIGGPYDNSGQGAAWIFTRSGGVWSQQGNKLVGTGGSGSPAMGASVSISADGNTAIVGGHIDSSSGAAWVFTRSGSVWSQQGSKLVGTGSSIGTQFGRSIALSADGNTAIIGGPYDNSNQGAAWIFTRSSGVWSQQGSKLVGTGNVGAAEQAIAVSVSADGNTAIIGGPSDNSNQGAAWIFTRSSGVWSQQGSKLVGTGSSGALVWQGTGVSLSADGNTAVIAAERDDGGSGSAWVFKRSSGLWSQQGSKLVGTSSVGGALHGNVAISADSNTIILGGVGNDTSAGAAWVFTN